MAQTETISISGPDGTFSGFLVLPAGEVRGGVLVVQEIFGVNIHIREVTQRIAAEGYVALAPDVFWRAQPNIALEYNDEGVQRGLALRKSTPPDKVVEDMKASLEALGARPDMAGKKSGVVGFCMGGHLAYLAATRLQPAASSCYYGGGIAAHLDEATSLQTPTQFHFGALDASIPMQEVEAIKEATRDNPKAEVFVYPAADHGFNCDKRPSFHPDSAKQAWARTIALFSQHIG